MREGTVEQLKALAQLVKRCLNLNGDERPTMKEVAIELEGLNKLSKHPWLNDQADHEEATSLIKKETQDTDLYSIELSSYGNHGKISEQFSSSSTKSLLR